MQPHELTPLPERAIAIGVGTKRTNREEAMEHLDELAFLAETAGADVLQKIYQALDRPERGTALGKGKLNELKEIVEQDEITMVIFDDDLSPAQVRNLERELNIKIMDRSGIILDIFASRARTTEAKLQVELAQLQYMLPRLTRLWTHLSKQFGGVGTKGPGETQIETDRRLVRDRITFLKDRLATVAVQKAEQRKGRDALQRFALVGYTNAGKSTLMNVLSGANVLAENKLFATLDTTVRLIQIGTTDTTAETISTTPDGNASSENGENSENVENVENEYGQHKSALLSDTVGFIRKLPPHLVASFRSTLAETIEADVIVHVADISHPQFREQILAVHETLDALGATGKPTIMVLNKIDALPSLDLLHSVQAEFEASGMTVVPISAVRGIGIQALKDRMMDIGDERHDTIRLLVPYSAMKEVAQLYRTSTILRRTDGDDGVELTARVEKRNLHLFEPWIKAAAAIAQAATPAPKKKTAKKTTPKSPPKLTTERTTELTPNDTAEAAP